jgi:pyruvate/2-oxoglutarate dehydrogenase complex dihydrolipoamide dehydrogenase (E3) component
MVPERCQNVIIGSGEGGKYLAWHLAQLGQPTMVIERRWIGGSCPNINCLPSKNEIWSAKVAHLARHAGEFGTIAGSVSIDMVAVRRRKREMAEALVAIHLKNYRETGAQLVMGEARFTGPKTLGTPNHGRGSQRPILQRQTLTRREPKYEFRNRRHIHLAANLSPPC